MSLNEQQKQQIGQNVNTILTSSSSIVGTILQKENIDIAELRKMEVVAAANISIALGTLIMFCLENAETSCILIPN